MGEGWGDGHGSPLRLAVGAEMKDAVFGVVDEGGVEEVLHEVASWLGALLVRLRVGVGEFGDTGDGEVRAGARRAKSGSSPRSE